MLKGPGFVIWHIPNLDETKAFYTDILGMTVADAQPGFVPFTNETPTTFALGVEGQGDENEVWWLVDDADAEHARLKAAGVEIVEEPTDKPFGRSVVIKDPVGRQLYLLQLPSAA